MAQECWCWCFGLVVLLLGSRGEKLVLSDEQWISVGRCRASCVEQFTASPPSSEQCRLDRNCNLCWDLCEKFVVDESSRDYMCNSFDDDVCAPGCRATCDATAIIRKTRLYANPVPWIFTSDPIVIDKGGHGLELEWTPPVPYSVFNLVAKDTFVVYEVLYKNSHAGEWQHELQSVDPWCSVKPKAVNSILEVQFLLKAISSEGVVAESTPILLPDHPHANDAPSVFDILEFLRNPDNHVPGVDNPGVETPSTDVTDTPDVVPAVPEIEYTLVQQENQEAEVLVDRNLKFSVHVQPTDGGVIARTYWLQPPTSHEPCTLWWGRESCHVDNQFPMCYQDRYKYHYAVEVTPDNNVDCSYQITELTYNSKYWLTLECPDTHPQSIYFVTPGCQRPNGDFTHCLDNSGGHSPLDRWQQVPASEDKTILIWILAACLLTVILVAVGWAIWKRKRKAAQKNNLSASRHGLSAPSMLGSESLYPSDLDLSRGLSAPQLAHNIAKRSYLNFGDLTPGFADRRPSFYEQSISTSDVSQAHHSPPRTMMQHNILLDSCQPTHLQHAYDLPPMSNRQSYTTPGVSQRILNDHRVQMPSIIVSPFEELRDCGGDVVCEADCSDTSMEWDMGHGGHFSGGYSSAERMSRNDQ